MNQIQQDVMCALLQTLLDQKLITQTVYDKSRKVILDTKAWPEFFSLAGKEESDGSA